MIESTQTSLTAESATVADQLRRGRISRVERRIEPPPLDAVFESGFYIPFNDVPIGDSGGPQVVANGNLAVSWVGSSFEGSVDENGEPGPSRARVGLSGAVTMEFGLEAGADVSTELRLALVELPPFRFGAIDISPFVEVRLRVEAAADTDGRISLVAPFRVGSRVSYDGSSDAALSSPPRFDPQVGLPDAAVDLRASIEVEIELVLLMSINTIPLGGPVLATALGARLTIDSAAGWDLDGTAEILGGWAFPDPTNLPFPDVPEDLETLHAFSPVDLGGEPGPFPVGAPSTRWSRLYDIGGGISDSAAAMLAAPDGLIVVEAADNPWLASLNEFGVPLWQGTAPDTWSPAAMVYATNGDLLVAGVDGGRMRLDRYNTQGDPQWTRTFEALDADSTTCVAIAPTTTNGAVLAGRVGRSSVLTPILTAVGEDGNVPWSIEVDMGSGSTDPKIVALATTPGGEFIAVGTVHYTETTDPVEPPIDRANALILRFTSEGVLVGGFALGGDGTEEALDVAVHPDGSYTVAGKLTGHERMTWLASISSADTLEWSAAYQSGPDYDANDVSEPTGLATLDDHGLLVSGTIGARDVNAWLMRVNRDGMPIWVKTYSSAETDDELIAVVALDGGVAACGQTQVTDDIHNDLWILRGNVDAMLHFTPDSGLTTENTAVQWERLRDQHTLRALTPDSTDTTMVIDSANELLTDPASVLGELVTE